MILPTGDMLGNEETWPAGQRLSLFKPHLRCLRAGCFFPFLCNLGRPIWLFLQSFPAQAEAGAVKEVTLEVTGPANLLAIGNGDTSNPENCKINPPMRTRLLL